MATINPTLAPAGNWQIFTWTGVTESDTFGAAAIFGTPKQATVQFDGTFGGATVVMQGSNTSAFTIATALDDIEDTAISSTADAGWELRYPWPYMRPSASGGSSQSLTVTLAVLIG